MAWTLAFAALPALLIAGGCGQKGRLYLPSDAQQGRTSAPATAQPASAGMAPAPAASSSMAPAP